VGFGVNIECCVVLCFAASSCWTIQTGAHIRRHLATFDQAECHCVFSHGGPIICRVLPVPQRKTLRLLRYDPPGTCPGRVRQREHDIRGWTFRLLWSPSTW